MMVTGAFAEDCKPWLQIVATNDQGTDVWTYDWAQSQASRFYSTGDYALRPVTLSNGVVFDRLNIELRSDPYVLLDFSTAPVTSATTVTIVSPWIPVDLCGSLLSSSALEGDFVGDAVFETKYNASDGEHTLTSLIGAGDGSALQSICGSLPADATDLQCELRFELAPSRAAVGRCTVSVPAVPEASSFVLALTIGLPALSGFVLRKSRS